MSIEAKQNHMIVIDGVDGSGKGVQTRRLYRSILDANCSALLTREPGGSAAAEDIRKILVEGEPEKWDSMTELLLMYAARRSHLRDTIWPAILQQQWIICDRFADSSRAFQGVAGELGLDTVERLHQMVVAQFRPAITIILDISESIALARANKRGGQEDRFEKKGSAYQAKVRQAFLSIAKSQPEHYKIVDANRSMDEVSLEIIGIINQHFDQSFVANTEIV